MMRCDHYLWKKQNHSQSLVRLSFICLFHQFTLMFSIALQYDTKIHHLLLQPEITYGRNDKVVTNWQSMKAKKALRFAYSVVSHRMILLVMQRSIAKPWTEMCESTANALSNIDIECPARWESWAREYCSVSYFQQCYDNRRLIGQAYFSPTNIYEPQKRIV